MVVRVRSLRRGGGKKKKKSRMKTVYKDKKNSKGKTKNKKQRRMKGKQMKGKKKDKTRRRKNKKSLYEKGATKRKRDDNESLENTAYKRRAKGIVSGKRGTPSSLDQNSLLRRQNTLNRVLNREDRILLIRVLEVVENTLMKFSSLMKQLQRPGVGSMEVGEMAKYDETVNKYAIQLVDSILKIAPVSLPQGDIDTIEVTEDKSLVRQIEFGDGFKIKVPTKALATKTGRELVRVFKSPFVSLGSMVKSEVEKVLKKVDTTLKGMSKMIPETRNKKFGMSLAKQVVNGLVGPPFEIGELPPKDPSATSDRENDYKSLIFKCFVAIAFIDKYKSSLDTMMDEDGEASNEIQRCDDVSTTLTQCIFLLEICRDNPVSLPIVDEPEDSLPAPAVVMTISQDLLEEMRENTKEYMREAPLGERTGMNDRITVLDKDGEEVDSTGLPKMQHT
jgi:hypothetical protein